MDRPDDLHGWSDSDGVVARARLAIHRWAMPGFVVLAVLLFAFSASQGFPDLVEAASAPVLAAIFAWAGFQAWRTGRASATLERVALFFALTVLVAAAIEPVITGRFEIGYPYVLGYAPLGYAAAFLFLGPRDGWRASGVTYLGLALATLAGVATGQIPAVRMVPLVVAHPILIGLLAAVSWSIAVVSRERALALEMAALDPLTGAFNRRSGEREMAGMRGAYALLVIDLDDFKGVNDTRGHAFGDTVLHAVAEGIAGHLRPDDLVVRWGGDEFLVVAPGANESAAQQLAERIRDAVRERSTAVGGTIGASVGVAIRGRDEAWRTVFERADRAMYRAKHGGDRSTGVQGAGGDERGPTGPTGPTEAT